MKDQKVVITDSESEINTWLNKGWHIISVTAQFMTAPNTGAYNQTVIGGKFCFVLEYGE